MRTLSALPKRSNSWQSSLSGCLDRPSSGKGIRQHVVADFTKRQLSALGRFVDPKGHTLHTVGPDPFAVALQAASNIRIYLGGASTFKELWDEVVLESS